MCLLEGEFNFFFFEINVSIVIDTGSCLPVIMVPFGNFWGRSQLQLVSRQERISFCDLSFHSNSCHFCRVVGPTPFYLSSISELWIVYFF